jgi:hypothetical protein
MEREGEWGVAKRPDPNELDALGVGTGSKQEGEGRSEGGVSAKTLASRMACVASSEGGGGGGL